MSDATTATAVTIAGRTYHLRGNGDPDYLQELASLVDARMRAIDEDLPAVTERRHALDQEVQRVAQPTGDRLAVVDLIEVNPPDRLALHRARVRPPRPVNVARVQ